MKKAAGRAADGKLAGDVVEAGNDHAKLPVRPYRLDPGIGDQLGQCPAWRVRPSSADQRQLGDLQRLVDVLLDQKDGDALVLAQCLDQREHLLHDDRRETKRRLVEDEQSEVDMVARAIASIRCRRMAFCPGALSRRGKSV